MKLRKKGVTYCTSYPATTLTNHEEKSRKLINRDCMTKGAATDSGLGMGTILNPPNRRHLAVLILHPILAVLIPLVLLVFSLASSISSSEITTAAKAP